MRIIFLFAACTTAFFFALILPANAQHFEFIENKGQWNNQVKFSSKTDAGAFYIQDSGYKVLLNNTADAERIIANFTGHNEGHSATVEPMASAGNLILRSHAYSVKFMGAAGHPKQINEPLKSTYNNYYLGNEPANWATGCGVYSELVYADIYPGIDIRYYTSGNRIKYDFLVHPGADASKIELLFSGVDNLGISGDKLVIGTSVGDVVEEKPYTWQNGTGGKIPIASSFEVTGNSVHFRLANYDKTKLLVIDPEIVFSSFTGSKSDNWGYCAAPDSQGNLYAAGIVFGNAYPVSVGAYQTTWAGGGNTGENGGFDVGIFKFNATGTQRLYATYIGGSAGNELPESLLVDAQGNLVVTGRSTSSNFPTTGTRIGTGGGWDMFVSKLNSTGTTLLGSRLIGGSSDDGVNIKHTYGGLPGPVSLQRAYGDAARADIAIDNLGNIYVASATQSNNFPLTAGAFQSTKSGLQDGVIIKFDQGLTSLLFASCLGGSNDDAIYGMAIAPGGDLYVAGGTASADFAGNKTGTVGPQYSLGICDGFIARISSDGSQLKRTTFIGTSGNDQVFGIDADQSGNIYIVATSTGNLPINNAAFSQQGGKQFIAKLDADFNSYIYSTVFGTNTIYPNIVPTAFKVDRCENVYVAGWGGTVIETNPPFPMAGTSGLTATANALQSTTDGRDFYTFVLAKNAASQLYGSFFGQNSPEKISDHSDGGKSRFDNDGTLYLGICANCQGGVFPATPGAWSTTNPSGRCNQAAVKIKMNFATCALPLQFLSFSGLYANDASMLLWQTAKEINSSYFDVEMSRNGVDFAAIGRVKANGAGDGSYRYLHQSPAPGIVYYRLRQVDKDGRFSYTGIITLRIDAARQKGLYLLPNPARDMINLVYPASEKVSTAMIVNSTGILVKSKTLPLRSSACIINIRELPAGIYYVYIRDGKTVEKQVFVKE